MASMAHPMDAQGAAHLAALITAMTGYPTELHEAGAFHGVKVHDTAEKPVAFYPLTSLEAWWHVCALGRGAGDWRQWPSVRAVLSGRGG